MSAGSTVLGLDRDVLQAPLGTAFETVLPQQLRRLLVVAGRQLEVHRARGAALEQLDLDLADAAADLEHGRALEAARLEERDHPPRRLVETALAVPLRHPARELLVEEAVAPARVAAAGHAATVHPSRPVDDHLVERAEAHRMCPHSLDVRVGGRQTNCRRSSAPPSTDSATSRRSASR